MTATPEFREAQKTKKECHGCEKCGKMDGLFSNQHGGIYLCHSCFFSSPTGWPAPHEKVVRPPIVRYEPFHDNDVWVELTEEQWQYAVDHSKAMREHSKKHDKDRPGYTAPSQDEQKALKIQMLGAISELAARKALHLPLELPAQTYRDADIPPDGEVRTIGDERYGLRVYAKDADSRNVIGVVVPKGEERGPYRIPGWISARVAKSHSEWRMDPKSASRDKDIPAPFWAVPQSALRSLSEWPGPGGLEGEDMDARELLKMAEKVLKYIEANADNPAKIREAIQRYREKRNG